MEKAQIILPPFSRGAPGNSMLGESKGDFWFNVTGNNQCTSSFKANGLQLTASDSKYVN